MRSLPPLVVLAGPFFFFFCCPPSSWSFALSAAPGHWLFVSISAANNGRRQIIMSTISTSSKGSAISRSGRHSVSHEKALQAYINNTPVLEQPSYAFFNDALRLLLADWSFLVVGRKMRIAWSTSTPPKSKSLAGRAAPRARAVKLQPFPRDRDTLCPLSQLTQTSIRLQQRDSVASSAHELLGGLSFRFIYWTAEVAGGLDVSGHPFLLA